MRQELDALVIRNSPSMSLTSTDILFFATVVNLVLKYLNVSLSTVVIVSSQEEIEAPSDVKRTRLELTIIIIILYSLYFIQKKCAIV